MQDDTQPKAPASARGLLMFAMAAAGALLLWIYIPIMAKMVGAWWNDPNYSHGFLVPLVSGYLVWRRWEQLKRVASGPSPWGLVVVAGGLFMLLAGILAHELYLQRISLIPVLWGTVWIIWGWPVAIRTIFAALYLVLMVPLPYVIYDAVAFPLRLIAADIAGWGIRLLGTPVLVEGNVLHLPEITLNVIDACSGIRSLISLLAAGVILAYVMLPNRWSKVLVILLVPPVAVFTNAMRVVVAGLLAQNFGPAMLEGALHDFTGWLVFLVAFSIMAGMTWGLRAALPPWSKRS